jgi:hypothetical protein
MKPHRLLMYTLVPLLAIGGYITADLLVAPSKTDAPIVYRLLAVNNCDLRTECILQHEALVIRLSREGFDQAVEGVRLKLEASEPLNGVAIALKEDVLPENMSSNHSDRQWIITLHDHRSAGILRLLLSTQETTYFAELPVTL